MSLSVLLVCRCEDNIDTLKRGLIVSDFRNVKVAKNHEDLATLISSGAKFDLAVIYIGDVPETDLELLSSVRQSFSNTECIIVSSSNDADLAAECFDRGACDYITKPFSKDTFASRLKKAAMYKSRESGRPRILIMEDDPVSGKLMKKHLDPYGDCTLVVNGIEAVQAFEQVIADGEIYQIVILDIMVPEIHGKEVLRRIREIEEQHGVPEKRRSRIIMTTALSDASNIVESFKSKCDSYLIKPIDRKMLIREIADLGFGSFVASSS